MSKFRQLLQTEYSTEYFLEYSEMKGKLYTGPFIYDAGGKLFDDAGKPIRWYVYYNFKHPVTGKMERVPPIYMDVNRFKTVKERTKAIKVVQKAVRNILESGYNRYTDEQIHFDGNRDYTVSEAVDYVLNIKEKVLKESSFTDYRIRLRQFEKFLLANGFAGKSITELSKKVVSAYLNEVLSKTSATNRNNTRIIISGFLGKLEEDEIIPVNFVKYIKIEEAKPQKNRTYTPQQESQIFEELQKNPLLLFFIQFVSLSMLREVEVCRLKVKDLDIKNKRLYVETKTKTLKTKIIPQILLDKIPNLSDADPEGYLISINGIGTHWDSKERTRRGLMGKHFSLVKKKFGLGKEYTIYSYRHTYITRLYQSLRKNKSPFEVKSELMLITGHTTITALEKYLRDIDAELPEDFSEHLI